jgi:Tol biopolymer transport system component/predicted Ser/Thr protein kinase
VIGRVLSHYRVLERIGRGGMGEVFVAEDMTLGRQVALKVLPEELAASEERRRRFEQEARVVAALNHPNIVTVHSVEEAEGVHFITMELVRGKRLSELLPKGGMAPSRFLEWAVPITEAVSAAHERGITHRDLKPDNIMVTEKGQPKILDFGLAKLRPEPGGTSQSELQTVPMSGRGQIVGTISHMSPEQAEGRAVDHRSDIFSLGVVFYEMLTGRRPFRGDSPASVLSSILKDTPPPVTELNPEIPRDLAKLCRRCLAKDPTRRYQTALDLRNELEDVRQDIDSGILEVAPAPRRHRGSWGIGVAAAMLAAAGAVVFLRWGHPGERPALQIQPLTSLEGMETDPTWSPDGNFVAFSHAGSGSLDIYVMSAGGDEPIRRTDGPADEKRPRWSPDNRHIAFVSDRGADAWIYLIPPLGGPERELVDTGLQPHLGRAELGAVPWSPDGQELLFSRRQPSGDIAIWKTHLVTGEETQVTNPPPNCEDLGATWSFDGSQVAFWRSEDGRGSLWLIPARGGAARPLLRDEHDNRAPAWSADGRRLVFGSDRAGPVGLWEIEVASGRLQPLIPNVTRAKEDDPTPVIGRNGKLAYTQKEHDVDLYWRDVASGRERQLTSDTGDDESARVSPDGMKVAYHSNRTGNNEIWLLDLATGEERALTSDPASDRLPDWSPDGQAILFVSDREGPSQLWAMNPQGGGLRRLSEQAISVSRRLGFPRWSPDGRLIGYLAPTDRGTALWVMEEDGTNARPLVFDVLHSEWYQDSRRVVYSRMRENGSELRAADLESGEEVLLLDVPHLEHRVSPDGRAVTYGDGTSHINQQLFLLRLAPPDSPGGLPRPLGEPVQLTEGRGLWHTHNGGWSPDGEAIVYTRDTDNHDIYVVENYE